MDRREKEVRKLNEVLTETRRKNQKVEEKINEQIEILYKKLEEYKLEHKQREDSIHEDITTKEEMLFTVKDSLANRKKKLELDLQAYDEADDHHQKWVFQLLFKSE